MTKKILVSCPGLLDVDPVGRPETRIFSHRPYTNFLKTLYEARGSYSSAGNCGPRETNGDKKYGNSDNYNYNIMVVWMLKKSSRTTGKQPATLLQFCHCCQLLPGGCQTHSPFQCNCQTTVR